MFDPLPCYQRRPRRNELAWSGELGLFTRRELVSLGIATRTQLRAASERVPLELQQLLVKRTDPWIFADYSLALCGGRISGQALSAGDIRTHPQSYADRLVLYWHLLGVSPREEVIEDVGRKYWELGALLPPEPPAEFKNMFGSIRAYVLGVQSLEKALYLPEDLPASIRVVH